MLSRAGEFTIGEGVVVGYCGLLPEFAVAVEGFDGLQNGVQLFLTLVQVRSTTNSCVVVAP